MEGTRLILPRRSWRNHRGVVLALAGSFVLVAAIGTVQMYVTFASFGQARADALVETHNMLDDAREQLTEEETQAAVVELESLADNLRVILADQAAATEPVVASEATTTPDGTVAGEQIENVETDTNEAENTEVAPPVE